MSYDFYRILHLIGVFGVLLSLGGMTVYIASGGTRQNFRARKFMAMIHGIALLLVLVAGFGLLARLNLMSSLPGWAITKLMIWLALGGLPALLYKKPQYSKIIFFVIWILGAAATYLAIAKPF